MRHDTKVTYSKPMLRAMMCVHLGFADRDYQHAAKNHGCAYAWALLPRVLLAEACLGRRLLPGLPAVRCGIQIRLGNHEAHPARRARQGGIRRTARAYA